MVGTIGTVFGAASAILFNQGILAAARTWWGLPSDLTIAWFSSLLIPPIVAAFAVTTMASWIGSRSVLNITPVQAFGSVQSTLEAAEKGGKPRRLAGAVILGLVGVVLLVFGSLLGMATSLGLFVAFPGGVIIGIGMITMFAVVGLTYYDALAKYSPDAVIATGETPPLLLPIIIVLSLAGFSALIAGVGLANSLTLSAIQRRKETALLRALGLTKNQIRQMTFFESLRMSLIAVAIGLILGIIYGPSGAFSLFGQLMQVSGHMIPSIPWTIIPIMIIAALVLTIAAGLAAVRRTINVPPVEVLTA